MPRRYAPRNAGGLFIRDNGHGNTRKNTESGRGHAREKQPVGAHLMRDGIAPSLQAERSNLVTLVLSSGGCFVAGRSRHGPGQPLTCCAGSPPPCLTAISTRPLCNLVPVQRRHAPVATATLPARRILPEQTPHSRSGGMMRQVLAPAGASMPNEDSVAARE